jgi:hypothetical protein
VTLSSRGPCLARSLRFPDLEASVRVPDEKTRRRSKAIGPGSGVTALCLRHWRRRGFLPFGIRSNGVPPRVRDIVILRDEDGVEWDCTEIHGGSAAAIAVRDGKVFRTLRFARTDNPAAIRCEIIVSNELDLNDPAIQRTVLRWARSRE